ncbi:hypothetical protein [Variovorax sp. E3]|uniref:hypothetical protein n=1 Tax=Variovorax sp. E3 TaxID=1914993 RepID=UPI0018DD803C|nr:hypothetical protein [Variovorax sp. E3]
MSELHRNPYAAPAAALERPRAALLPARRPITAWLVQLLSVVVCGLSVTGLWGLTVHLVQNPQFEWAVAPAFFEYAFRLGFVACAVGALVGTQRRAAYGRWSGLLLLAGVVVLIGYLKFGGHVSSSSTSYWRLAPTTDDSAEAVGIVLLFCILACWAYAFGFSAKARKFFCVAPVAESTNAR